MRERIINKKETVKKAIQHVKGRKKKSPREFLLELQSHLTEILKEIKTAIENSEGWHDGMAIESVQRQIEEARWNH
ncbi:MAG: hypothetical protein J6T57_03750 [Alphaproteobacteria bacterium]|nr:hypothetical protein [Alphaproteobacteria bacterium]